MTLRPPDFAAVARHLNVEGAAIQAASDERPPPDQGGPEEDFDQQRIITYYRELAQEAREVARNQIAQLKETLIKTEVALTRGQLANSLMVQATNGIGEMATYVAREMALVDSAEKRAAEKRRAYEMFINVRKIKADRKPIRPDPPILTYSLGFMLSLLVSFAYSYFFSVGETAGFGGVWKYAIVLTLLFLIMSAGAGLVIVPNALYGHDYWTKVLARSVFAAYIVAAVSGLIVAAHFRLALMLAPMDPKRATITRVLETPADVMDVASIFQVLGGLVYAGLLVWLFYRSREPIPGYADIQRALEDETGEYARSRSAMHLNLEAKIKELASIIHRQYVALNAALHAYLSIEQHRDDILESYSAYVVALGAQCHAMLNLYRDTNQQHRRTTTFPAYVHARYDFVARLGPPNISMPSPMYQRSSVIRMLVMIEEAYDKALAHFYEHVNRSRDQTQQAFPPN